MSFVSIDLSRKVASTIISDVMIDDSSVLMQVNISQVPNCKALLPLPRSKNNSAFNKKAKWKSSLL